MSEFDLLVVGGGINGAGIARDAAGRGLSVLLLERNDLAGATSSWSSKLIHGGLRYLEQYEFRLVGEALAEREVLLSIAGHLVWPARFVMPHVPELRPRWMIRIGLFLYDHLGRRTTLPGSRSVRLDAPPYADGLGAGLRHGFEYSDCRVDDARLVIANALDAQARGAEIRVRTELVSARREGGGWLARLRDAAAEMSAIRCHRPAATIFSMTDFAWDTLNTRLAQPSRDNVRLVKGSHIVVPRRYAGEHAFILQNDDRRVVFMIPYEEDFTLIGTTDEPFEGDPLRPEASTAEIDYLCRAANRYLAAPVTPQQVRWHYAGVRPLYDDGTDDPSSITRDYTLRVDEVKGAAPVLSIFGGKITTYRVLAEHAMEKLKKYFPKQSRAWTAKAALPGSDFGGGPRIAARDAFYARYPGLPKRLLRTLFHRHGTHAAQVLGDARSDADLGEAFGADLTEREIRYLREHEWARTAEDVLWRRTKAGLRLDAAAQARVAAHMDR